MISMGRIKTVLVKRVTKKLFEDHEEEFTEDFSKNKEVIDKYTKTQSPKLRNVIAGYVTRIVKQSKQEEKPRKIVSDKFKA